eukprot:890881-Rhodomonas_salina.2
MIHGTAVPWYTVYQLQNPGTSVPGYEYVTFTVHVLASLLSCTRVLGTRGTWFPVSGTGTGPGTGAVPVLLLIFGTSSSSTTTCGIPGDARLPRPRAAGGTLARVVVVTSLQPASTTTTTAAN